MKVLCNYADRGFYESQKKNKTTGISIGGFDCCYSWKKEDLDEEFVSHNQEILAQQRGAGYYIWKPYIILLTMQRCQKDDIIFYLDSGSYFVDRMDPIFELITTHGFVVFDIPGEHYEGMWTKRDTYLLLDADTPEIRKTKQREGGLIGLVNNETNRKRIEEWLHYAQDTRIISDNPNTLGESNYPEFKEHRHDQSIISILTKKWGLKSWLDPTQWGEYHTERPYPTLIYLTRDRR